MPAANAEEMGMLVTDWEHEKRGECTARLPGWQAQLGERPRGGARTWSVSVVIWMGQAASVFHRKVTTHSQMRENMGWVF